MTMVSAFTLTSHTILACGETVSEMDKANMSMPVEQSRKVYGSMIFSLDNRDENAINRE